MNFLVTTIDDVITLEADDSGKLYWCIDASFAIHKENMRSHMDQCLQWEKVRLPTVAVNRKKLLQVQQKAN